MVRQKGLRESVWYLLKEQRDAVCNVFRQISVFWLGVALPPAYFSKNQLAEYWQGALVESVAEYSVLIVV